ncbi:DUF3718 domain-containing protein [Thalassotalea psychrophila]|uniref:DUF3718 domain-containing protein n=1 Tax=Thalassotalea psychrophila TaxID=3065647 RepID=A0ABY9TRY7_9GAMM|nr:DUF3718 domain-containing protein [Colwelliaceae bacterium SQ149]
MKFANLSILALLIGASPVTLASQYKFVATDNNPLTKICLAAVQDNLLRYTRVVKNNGFTYQVIANHLKCNDQNIADFAYSYNSIRTAKFINVYRKHAVSFTEIAVHSSSKGPHDIEVIYITSK